MSDFIKYITWLIYLLFPYLKTPAVFNLWYHKINFERKIHQSTEFDILLWSWHSLLEMLENVRFSSRFKSNNFQSLSLFVKKSRKKSVVNFGRQTDGVMAAIYATMHHLINVWGDDLIKVFEFAQLKKGVRFWTR